MYHAVRTTVLMVVVAFLFAGCAVPLEEYNELERKYTELGAEKKALQTKYDKALLTIRELQAKPESEPAPAPVTTEDMDLPINERTGGIMLAESVLFSSGSSTVKKDAGHILRKLAGLLNSDAHAAYDIRVDGYTDDQPIVKTRNINKDNWFLSVKRAHAVMEKLTALGVKQERFIICGYGPKRPVESNKPGRKGNPKNRRVEILLTRPE